MRDEIIIKFPIHYKGHQFAEVQFKRDIINGQFQPIRPAAHRLEFTVTPPDHWGYTYCRFLLFNYVIKTFFNSPDTSSNELAKFSTQAELDESYIKFISWYALFRDLMNINAYSSIDERLIIYENGRPLAYATQWRPNAKSSEHITGENRVLISNNMYRCHFTNKDDQVHHFNFNVLPIIDDNSIAFHHFIEARYLTSVGVSVAILRSPFFFLRTTKYMLTQIDKTGTYPEGFKWGIREYILEK